MVLRCLTDLALSEVDLALACFGGDGGKRGVTEDHEPAVIPGAVVANVDEEEVFHEVELRGGRGGGPEGEVGDEPLPVGPDVVVLGVFGEHAAEEGELVRWKEGELGHDGLAVVPVWRIG